MVHRFALVRLAVKTRSDVVRILLLGALGLGVIGLVFIDADDAAYLSPTVRVSSSSLGSGLLIVSAFALMLGLMARQRHAAAQSLLRVGRNAVIVFGVSYLGWFAWSITQAPPPGSATPLLLVATGTLIVSVQIYYIWTWCAAAITLLDSTNDDPAPSR